MEAPELLEEGTPEAERLRVAILEHAAESFTLDKGPLFRVNLFRVGCAHCWERLAVASCDPRERSCPLQSLIHMVQVGV